MNKLRQYKTGTPEYELYKEMHKNQTVDFLIETFLIIENKVS